MMLKQKVNITKPETHYGRHFNTQELTKLEIPVFIERILKFREEKSFAPGHKASKLLNQYSNLSSITTPTFPPLHLQDYL
jgi:hypothetical protein